MSMKITPAQRKYLEDKVTGAMPRGAANRRDATVARALRAKGLLLFTSHGTVVTDEGRAAVSA